MCWLCWLCLLCLVFVVGLWGDSVSLKTFFAKKIFFFFLEVEDI